MSNEHACAARFPVRDHNRARALVLAYTRSTRKFRAGAAPTHQPSGSRASSAAAAAPLHGTSSVLSAATSPDRRRRIPEAQVVVVELFI